MEEVDTEVQVTTYKPIEVEVSRVHLNKGGVAFLGIRFNLLKKRIFLRLAKYYFDKSISGKLT